MQFLWSTMSQPIPLNCSEFGINATAVSPMLINWESRLHACFLNYPYDITQLPVPPSAMPLSIDFDWAIINLISFQDGIIKITYQFSCSWVDYLKSWNPLEIPIMSLKIPLQEIWYPDFYFEQADDKKYIYVVNPKEFGYLYSNGLIYFTIGNIVQGKCSLNLWNFPFDNQSCKLSYIFLKFFNDQTKMDVIVQKSPYAYRFDSILNDEWEVLNMQTNSTNITGVEYKYRADGTIDDTHTIILQNFATGFDVYINLRRYFMYYIVNIITPLIALSVLDMLPFAMEDDANEKLVTAVSVVLGFMFLQGIVANLLPKSDVTPYLALYVASSLVLSVISVITEVFCYSLCYRRGKPGLYVQFIVLKILLIILYPSRWPLLFKRWKAKRSKIQVASVTSKVKLSSSSDMSNCKLDELSCGWPEIANVMNRVFALLHMIASLTLFGVFLVPILVTRS